jgi:hypothetical protein
MAPRVWFGEKAALTRRGELLPEFEPWGGTAKRRVADLLTPFESCVDSGGAARSFAGLTVPPRSGGCPAA